MSCIEGTRSKSSESVKATVRLWLNLFLDKRTTGTLKVGRILRKDVLIDQHTTFQRW